MNKYKVSIIGRVAGGILGGGFLAGTIAVFFFAPGTIKWWGYLLALFCGGLFVYAAVSGRSPEFIEDDIKFFQDK